MHIRFPLALLAATALVGPGAAQETTAWRLFVGDHAEGRVTVIDPVAADTIASFDLAGPPSLYTEGSNIFAVQGAANQVSAIRSGIAIDDHGDHGDIDITDPVLVDATVTGERPVHFVGHDGDVAIFFDGSGLASILDADAWIAGEAVEPREIDSGAPHHGVAIPWGDYTIVSVPHPENPSNLPIGVNVLDAEGNLVGDTHGCADLHGEASSGNILAIACAEGLLLLSGSGEPEVERIGYDGLPDGKSTTLIGGRGMQYFVGNYGPDKVVIIEPGAEQIFRLVELPTRRVHFVADPVRPRFAYIFTEDGDLHQLDVVSGKIAQTVRVTEPYSMDGEWSLPRPRLAVAGDHVAVTDPLAGVVHMIEVDTFTVAETIAVDGLPYTVVAVGGSGTQH